MLRKVNGQIIMHLLNIPRSKDHHFSCAGAEERCLSVGVCVVIVL